MVVSNDRPVIAIASAVAVVLQAHLLHGRCDLRRTFAFTRHEVNLVLAILRSDG